MSLKRRAASQNGLYSKAIDLGEISPLRFAQYQQWHDLLITGPTRSVVGFAGNDFPGLYYYDPRTQTEHVMMVSSPVDWRYCTLGRRVTEIPDKPGSSRLELGLFSERPIANGVQLKHASRKRVVFGPQPSDRDAMPDQWEALEMLAKESFKLLPLPASAPPYDWEEAAATCLKTLSKTIFKRQRNDKDIWVFFQTFVYNKSTYKPEPNQEHERSTELICQAGLCAALLDYAALKPKDQHAFQSLGKQLAATLPDFYDAKTGIFQNTYPPRGEEWDRGVIDTWYAFHNLYQVLRAARLSKDAPLKERAFLAVERMIRFVKACEYEIPLFAKLGPADGGDPAEDGKVIGFALNPSVLGMYAALLVLASLDVPGKAEAYRVEAVYALARLRRWPLSQMFHETVQLSWAASAAHALGETGWRDDFTRCLLLSCYRQGDIAGLFQGCAGLRYPAFRETVQAVEPWAQWLRDAPGELPLKEILAHVLSKAKTFLVTTAFNDGLPQEGLATLEQPEADKVGIAIYAAPQVFELARLQKQLGGLGKL